jgi:hypothetical protein
VSIVDDVFSEFLDSGTIFHGFPAVAWNAKSDRSVGILLVYGKGRIGVIIIVCDVIFGVWYVGVKLRVVCNDLKVRALFVCIAEVRYPFLVDPSEWYQEL